MRVVANAGVRAIVGPIPLPDKRTHFTVIRGPHIDKKSREQYVFCTHKRLIDVSGCSVPAVDALMRLELPSSVNVVVESV